MWGGCEEELGHGWLDERTLKRSDGLPVSIVQKSQEFHADFTPEGKAFQRIDGRLNGTQITFSFTDTQGVMKTFEGEVAGETFTGTLKDDSSVRIVGKR